jgi:hypothetical protein
MGKGPSLSAGDFLRHHTVLRGVARWTQEIHRATNSGSRRIPTAASGLVHKAHKHFGVRFAPCVLGPVEVASVPIGRPVASDRAPRQRPMTICDPHVTICEPYGGMGLAEWHPRARREYRSAAAMRIYDC